MDLWPVVVALMKWGDRYLSPGTEPVLLFHRECGGSMDDRRICQRCGRRSVHAMSQRGVGLANRPAPGGQRGPRVAGAPLRLGESHQ